MLGQIGAKISENPNFWVKFSKQTQKYYTMEPFKKSKSNPKSAKVSKSPYNDGQKSKIFQKIRSKKCKICNCVSKITIQ